MSPRWLRTVIVASPLLLATACQQASPPRPVAGSASAGTATPVALIVDGASLTPVDAAAITGWVQLDHVLPPEARSPTRWLSIVLIGSGPAAEIPTPTTTHPGLVAALFPGASGTSFGMFTPAALAAHGTPAVLQAGVKEVRVVLAPVGGAAPSGDGGGGGDGDGDRVDPGNFSIDVAGKPFTRAQLEALPAATAPAGDTQTKGWALADVLRATGVAPTGGQLVLTDASGATLRLPAADLAPDKGAGFLKLNRQGQIRFKWFRKDATGWRGAGDLRGLTSIAVAP